MPASPTRSSWFGRGSARLLLAALACALTLGAPTARAGDLEPPPGPVAPTMKPLDEIEPRRAVNALPGDAIATHIIDQPGAYHLTADILGEPGKRGVDIRASRVAIDLRGFSLVGAPGSLDGVFAESPIDSVVIRGGGAHGWGGAGVNLLGARGATLREIDAADNAGPGMVAGNGARFERCAARDNGGGGLLGGDSTVFESCIAQANEHDGFYALEGSVWTGCVAWVNGGSGYYLDGDACHIADSTAFANFLHGVVAIYIATVTDVIATGNGRSGVYAGQGGTVRACTLSRNGHHGLFAPNRTSAEGCRFEGNGLSGVFAQADSSVRGCDAVDNAGDGILLGSRGVAEGNLCAGNGLVTLGVSAGVRATGADCRIDGNTLVGNARGVVAESARCLVTRNDVGAAPGAPIALNYALAPGTSFGPIVDISGGGDLAAAPGSEHPLANLSR